MTDKKNPEVPSVNPKKPEIPTRKPEEAPPIDVPEKPGSDDQEGDELLLPVREPEEPRLPNKSEIPN
ncbi:MAG: hypothetical protein ACOH2E_07505 [Candidatus Paracaedibacter sp.]|jgi:hypothetical protein